MHRPCDGDLYRKVELHGRCFELRYGYYEEFERARGEPIPIYPDFAVNPQYTDEGYPFVTQMQALCAHGESRFADGCCADCRHYLDGAELIGICLCPHNKKTLHP